MSATSSDTGHWIPLMDYAMKNGVSLSTLRRHIKSGKIRNKNENGKYFIFDEGYDAFDLAATPFASSAPPAESRVSSLESELKKAQEEIAELKMLVDLYEERLFKNIPAQL